MTQQTMSLFRRIDLIEPHYHPSLFLRETSIFAAEPLAFPSFVEEAFDLSFGLDLLNPKPSPIAFFDAVTDLVRINERPSFASYRRIQRVEKRRGPEHFYLQSLCDRVSELESRFDRLVNAREKGGDRKYTWTAEIKSPEKDGVERKYKWTAEIKGGKKKVGGTEKNYKWTEEIKGRGEAGRPIARTYTFKASSGDAGDCSGLKENKKKGLKGESDMHVVEIEDPADHGAVILRQVFPIITDL